MASAAANRYARALVDIVMSPGSVLKPEDAVAQLRAQRAPVAERSRVKSGDVSRKGEMAPGPVADPR